MYTLNTSYIMYSMNCICYTILLHTCGTKLISSLMHTRCARRLQLNIHFLQVNYQQYICTIKKSKPYNLLLWWWLLFLWIFSFYLEGKICISKHMLDPKIERNSKCFFHIFADRLIDTKADWNHQATMRRIKEMENSLLFSIFMWSLWAK